LVTATSSIERFNIITQLRIFLFSKQIEMGLTSFIDRTDRNGGIIKKSLATSRIPGKVAFV
jgi:hypothetical protein